MAGVGVRTKCSIQVEVEEGRGKKEESEMRKQGRFSLVYVFDFLLSMAGTISLACF